MNYDIIDKDRVKSRDLFGDDWVYNQGNIGSCNGCAGAKALERSRVKSGMDHVVLSGEYLYSRINDSRDIGSMLDDGYQEENGKLFIAMPKESVGVTLFVIPNDNGKQIRKIRYTIEVEGKSDDKVTPEPDDKVNTRFNKSDYLVLIEESSERSAEVAKLVNSAFWLTELKSLGFNRPLINDKDSEQGKSFIEAAKLFGMDGKVPFLAIMDKDGSFIDAFEVPKSADELKGVLGL